MIRLFTPLIIIPPLKYKNFSVDFKKIMVGFFQNIQAVEKFFRMNMLKTLWKQWKCVSKIVENPVETVEKASLYSGKLC